MENKEILEESFNLVARDFGTGETLDSALTYDSIKKWLTERIQNIIDTQVDRLWNILYRIDVNEHKVRNAIDECEPEELANAIAGLVLDRQIQKIKTRKDLASKK